MYVCMYISVGVCMYVMCPFTVHRQAEKETYADTCPCMHMCTQYTHTYIHAQTHTICKDIQTYTYTFTHTHTYIHTDTHTHTVTHTYQSYINKLDDDCSTFNSSKLLHDITDGPLSYSIMECYCFL